MRSGKRARHRAYIYLEVAGLKCVCRPPAGKVDLGAAASDHKKGTSQLRHM